MNRLTDRLSPLVLLFLSHSIADTILTMTLDFQFLENDATLLHHLKSSMADNQNSNRQKKRMSPAVNSSEEIEEEARREDNTVFVGSLPLRATEQDIYEFLKEVS